MASTARRAIALAIAAGALGLCAVGLAGRGPADARGVATAALLGVVVGSCVPLLESALRAGGGRWLDAFGNVIKRPCGPEPDDTIREALMTLRAPTGLGFASPELWTFAPTTRSTVDAAGYLHRMSAELPAELPRLAAGEPFGVLRSEVLAAVEVRRPDLRYLAEWMEARQVLAATILAHDGEIDGLLVLPRGNRREPMTLTEVRSMRRVADHLAAPCRARMAESTMRTQVLEADTRVTLAEGRLNERERERERCAELSSLWTSRLASMASVGAYSAGARLALQSLETRMSSGASVFFVVPGGFDPPSAPRASPSRGSKTAGAVHRRRRLGRGRARFRKMDGRSKIAARSGRWRAFGRRRRRRLTGRNPGDPSRARASTDVRRGSETSRSTFNSR